MCRNQSRITDGRGNNGRSVYELESIVIGDDEYQWNRLLEIPGRCNEELVGEYCNRNCKR